MEPRDAVRTVLEAALALQRAHEDLLGVGRFRPHRALVWVCGRVQILDPRGETVYERGFEPLDDAPMMAPEAPEQAAGSRAGIGTRTDVHLLGRLLVDLVDGPLPTPLAAIATQAMDPEPRLRYRTAEHMAEDLARWLDERPVMARQSGPAHRLARRCVGLIQRAQHADWSWLIVAGLMAMIACGMWRAIDWRHDQVTRPREQAPRCVWPR